MEVNKPEVAREVEIALEGYLDALRRNDLAQLNEVFWDSENTVRFGAGETLIGASQIRAFRNNRASRSPLQIRRVLITTFGEDTATVCILFDRADDVVGRWSQHWARLDGAWRITSAHVSSAQFMRNMHQPEPR